MVLFIAKIHAAEAVLAALAVIGKSAVGAVEAISAKIAVVAFLHVDALVTEFGFFHEGAIDAVPAQAYPKSVKAVLGLDVADDSVAVFPCGMVRAEVRVFAPDRQNARHRA